MSGELELAHLKEKTIIALLALAVAIEGTMYVDLQSQYYEIRSSFIKLDRKFTILQDQYSGLGRDYNSLQSRYSGLKELYSGLQVNDSSLWELIDHEGDYVGQRESIITTEILLGLLRESYINLRRTYEVEATLRIGNNLESYYDLVRYENGLTVSHWGDIQREADFCAKLAMHDIGWNSWPSIEHKYYRLTKKHSYEMSRRKIEEVIDLIGLRAYHTPTYKIKTILEFVQQNVHYENELDNVYLSPIETLGFKSGDCDDFSILASALFEAVGIDSAIGIFTNSEGRYHCMVLVHLEDLEGYGYSSYSDLTSQSLEEGKWIVIEPQNTIDQQDSNSVGSYSLVAVAPLD